MPQEKKVVDAPTVNTGDRAHASTTGNWANASTSGDRAHASTTGNWANASTSGDWANASTSGDVAHASTTGDWAHASTTGDLAHASTTGEHAVSAALGIGSMAKAGDGGAIVLCYRKDHGDGELIHIRASKVGENGIKPGVWYRLSEAGEFVEAGR